MQNEIDRNLFLTSHIDKLRPMIMGTILTQVPDFEKADDIFQDINVTICEKFSDFDPKTNFKAWVMKITRYKILTAFQKIGRDQKMVKLSGTILEELENVVDHEEVEEYFQLKRMALRKCLEKVTPHQRKVLLKRYGEHCDLKMAAKELNITVKSTYVTLSRLRSKLGDCIKQVLMQMQKKTVC